MEPDVSPTVPEETTEEMITISKSEYDNLCAPKPSFWTEALKNPEGTNGVKEFIQGILQTGLTLYGEKILKGQLIYSALRTILVIALLAGTVIWYKLSNAPGI